MQIDINDVLAESYRALGEAVVMQRLLTRETQRLVAENEELRSAGHADGSK